MNNENLKMFDSNQSREQAAINGRKGGIASGKARRQRKAFKESLEILLSMKAPDKIAAQIKNTLPKLKDKDLNYQNAILVSLLQQAVKGNTKAVELIRDTIGEKPKEVVEISGNEQIQKGLSQLNDLL